VEDVSMTQIVFGILSLLNSFERNKQNLWININFFFFSTNNVITIRYKRYL
jgi:hypothetical protein